MGLLENTFALGGSPWASIAVAFIAAISVPIAFKVIYNLFWHPLAKFPGPILRCVSDLPDAIAVVRGNQHTEIEKLHRLYGHVVRISPGSLSYTSSEAWRDIYALKADRSELAKDPNHYNVATATSLINADQTEHARMRRVIAPFFADGSLFDQEPLLRSYFDLFVTKLKQQVHGNAHGRVDLMAYFNFVTFDIIGEMVLGKPFGALESGEYHAYIRNIFESIKTVGLIRLASKFNMAGLMFKLMKHLMPSIGAKREAHMKFTEEKVNKRLVSPADKDDLIAHIHRHEANGKIELSTEEMIINCRIFLVAGSETTATHLTGVAWFLLNNPEKLKRAQLEVRSVFQNADQITLRAISQVDRLPYLNAVIQETFRCYPSVPSILPRITNPEGNIIAGRFVPGGTSIGVHHWSAYRHPDNFHQPDEFIPERWLPDAASCFRADNREALQPFHPGPRGCLGKSLAYYEIRSLLARLLWHFELELRPESRTWFENKKDHIIWDKPSLWVNLTERQL